MKMARNKQTCATTKTQAKTGFLSSKQIRLMFHLNRAAQPTGTQLNPLILELAGNEKEIRAYEIEAELRKASARTYANPTLIR